MKEKNSNFTLSRNADAWKLVPNIYITYVYAIFSAETGCRNTGCEHFSRKLTCERCKWHFDAGGPRCFVWVFIHETPRRFNASIARGELTEIEKL